jgi:hypothetical protein
MANKNEERPTSPSSARLRKEKRSTMDFSKHILVVHEDESVLRHTLKLPDSEYSLRINFINVKGYALLVTGDFGRWSFYREFHPSPEGYVSDGYWHEKLATYSTQDGYEYDKEGTKESLEEGINGGLEEYGYTGEDLAEMISYYERFLDEHDENGFLVEAWAYTNYPSCMDVESIPFEKITKPQLRVIFDAFNHVCDMIAEQEKNEAKRKIV